MKKNIFLFAFGLLVATVSIQAQDWTKVWETQGEAAEDFLGNSISLSADGSILAIGAFHNDATASNAGHVRIFKDNSGTWTQIGADIDGEEAYELSGASVSLSADGSTVAIGAPNKNNYTGQARIYRNNSGAWMQIGANLDGEEAGDLFGFPVSLSADGSIVAIGAYNSDVNGTFSGQVRIYQDNAGTWTQIGQDINGEAGDWSGSSVGLSADGSIVAIGAFSNDENGTGSGHVRIFQNISGTWTQIGQDIDGEAEGDLSGYRLSISADGSIVAIGAHRNDGNGIDAGHVRIFQNISGTWTQIGQDIDGEAAGDRLGSSVSLSADGSIVAVGAPFNDGNGADAGQVRIYQNNSGTWTQIGAYIAGETADSWSGYSVSLSADGSTVAIGAPGNNSEQGQVSVYKYGFVGIPALEERGISIYPNPSTGVFTIKNAKDYEITISDITGKIVYHSEPAADEQVRLQKKGVYIINFKSERRMFSSKIIIE